MLNKAKEYKMNRPNESNDTVSRPRSVFANYQAPSAGLDEPALTKETTNDIADPAMPGPAMPDQLDGALARSFIYQLLARAYEYPVVEGWSWLSEQSTETAFRSCVKVLEIGSSSTLDRDGDSLIREWRFENYDQFVQQYVEAFGHAARGSCPLNEIEYGDLKADPLFQPHRLADLVAFYRAFGLEVAEQASERQDHISFELEFMSVLTAKEAHAIQSGFANESLSIYRHAQSLFLQEHLGRWSIAFTRRLARAAGHGPLFTLAEFTRTFMIAECQRLNVKPGGDELSLRPVNPAAESLCSSCGIEKV